MPAPSVLGQAGALFLTLGLVAKWFFMLWPRGLGRLRGPGPQLLLGGCQSEAMCAGRGRGDWSLWTKGVYAEGSQPVGESCGERGEGSLVLLKYNQPPWFACSLGSLSCSPTHPHPHLVGPWFWNLLSHPLIC